MSARRSEIVKLRAENEAVKLSQNIELGFC